MNSNYAAGALPFLPILAGTKAPSISIHGMEPNTKAGTPTSGLASGHTQPTAGQPRRMCDSDRAFAPTIRSCGGAAVLSQDDPIQSSTEKDPDRMEMEWPPAMDHMDAWLIDTTRIVCSEIQKAGCLQLKRSVCYDLLSFVGIRGPGGRDRARSDHGPWPCRPGWLAATPFRRPADSEPTSDRTQISRPAPPPYQCCSLHMTIAYYKC